MNCDNDCRPPHPFPMLIFNRPGLETIDYRIGSYADLRAHMLALLDSAPALAEWNHRLPDDPGIALIEAAAEVGDILSFYHALYANEAYLRSAKWHDSVAELVRLLGYRLAPGISGRTRFAFAVKGSAPVLLPAGISVKAQLDGEAQPAVFETGAALLAYPALSQFHLYRPRIVPKIGHGDAVFTLEPDAGASVLLKPGDRVMAAVERADGDGTVYDHMQVLVVDKVSSVFGITVVTMKSGLTSLAPPPRYRRVAGSPASALLPLLQLNASMVSSMPAAFAVLPTLPLSATPALRAWKLGATHRHFGHDAPASMLAVAADGQVSMAAVSYNRRLAATTGAPAQPSLSPTRMPLAGDVPGIAAGALLLAEARFSPTAAGAGRKRLLERRITALEKHSLSWGPQTGASTMLTLDETLAFSEGGAVFGHADIRAISLHEVIGAAFTLRAEAVPTAAARGRRLQFFGTAAEAAPLAGRSLLLAGPGATLTRANALALESAADVTGQARFHDVLLDRECDYAQFDHAAPQVTVYGNLIDATEGKTEDLVTLGDGDARALFQTFAVPKAPLAYLLDTTQEPPQSAQLHVWVDGVQWRCVDSLFGHGPREQIYIVREDADGKSRVQFGDGKTGARLRSGRGNVLAQYRTGTGARGPLKTDTTPQPDKKVAALDKAFLLEPVTGGASAESADGARSAAPGTMQSLGRIVSLADYEAEALAIPGVLKARAAWVSVDGAALVRVTVLTDSAGLAAAAAAADAAGAADALRAAVRARGAGRCPLLVVAGKWADVRLRLVVGHDPALRADAVRDEILAALGAQGTDGASETGLFSWQQRQFGMGVHGSQVVAAVQNVSGVVWVRLLALAHAGPAPVTSGAVSPQAPAWLAHTLPIRRALTCPGEQMLALRADAVQLQLTADKEGIAP